MPRVKDIINPLDTDRTLSHEETLYVRKLQRVRKGARAAARSGHPGRRAEGKKALLQVPGMIRKVYIDNMMGVVRDGSR